MYGGHSLSGWEARTSCLTPSLVHLQETSSSMSRMPLAPSPHGKGCVLRRHSHAKGPTALGTKPLTLTFYRRERGPGVWPKRSFVSVLERLAIVCMAPGFPLARE